ncbi:hypothetical protein ACH5RR_015522 [Cinchona calisaya]|uniref:Phospho-N-acetylmuramoyl-pentapeptide- transferase homolog n=1 Tax=Cinchona calisaya TaxID=153742 RepID=A0ABD2ZTS7_9GENT
MRSHPCVSIQNNTLCSFGFLRSGNGFSSLYFPVSRVSFDSRTCGLHSYVYIKVIARSGAMQRGFCLRRKTFLVDAMDEGSVGFSSFHDLGDTDGSVEDAFSSSEGEASDGEIVLQPITDIDLPTTKEHFRPADDSITMAAHRFATLGRVQKRRKSIYGILNNIGLMMFLTVVFVVVDWCAWRIVRLPLAPFYLIRPFVASTAIVSSVGYICVPLIRILKLQSIVRKEDPARHSYKRGTPTMGGIYFIPIAVIVAEVIVGFSSIEVSGASAVTLAFAVIGFIDDLMSLKNTNNGLSAWMRIFLEVAVTTSFLFWFYTTEISSPYSMKMLVPIPAPVGLLYLGTFYPLLTSFCFVSMANGVNLTDGLDGLAGGTAALAFTGMSIAVLPICSDLAVFGASMAGACAGFLFHNRYRASIFMGDTGALGLGGALAAMASCTGMFFPLFISSGVFVIEALSVIMQVFFFKATKHLQGTGRRLFRMAPLHHHLELCGVKEPVIVAGAYVISCMLILFAGYVGLISV